MIFSCILWSTFENNFEDAIKDIENSGLRIVRKNIFTFEDKEFQDMLKKVYEPDSIADWKVQKKLEELEKRNRILCYFEIEIPSPNYRIKSDGRHISIVTENIKKFIREKYSSLKPFEGKPDILIHMGDTHEHTNFVFNVLKHYSKKTIRLEKLFKEISENEYSLVKVHTPYQPLDFPKNYALGKDIDVLVSGEDSFLLYEKIKKFSDYHDGLFKIEEIYEKDGYRFRFLNQDNTLHYQIDVKVSSIANFKNIKKGEFFNELTTPYECLVRLNAIKEKPHKVHHKDFIIKNKNKIKMNILKKYGMIDLYENIVREEKNV